MDLSAIKPQSIKVDISHPGTGDATGLVIEVASSETDAVKKVRRKYTDKVLKSRDRKLTADQIETSNIEILAASVVGWQWKGEAAWGGKKLDFSTENVITVLGTDWIRSQVQEAANDEASFFTS